MCKKISKRTILYNHYTTRYFYFHAVMIGFTLPSRVSRQHVLQEGTKYVYISISTMYVYICARVFKKKIATCNCFLKTIKSVNQINRPFNYYQSTFINLYSIKHVSSTSIKHTPKCDAYCTTSGINTK